MDDVTIDPDTGRWQIGWEKRVLLGGNVLPFEGYNECSSGALQIEIIAFRAIAGDRIRYTIPDTIDRARREQWSRNVPARSCGSAPN
jgi:hypothetical protein